MRQILIIALLFLAPTTVLAGPFGLEMAMSLSELNKKVQLKLEEPHIYSTKIVPKPHPDFEAYRLIITPTQGLCKISAISRDISTSVYGSELLSKFNTLEEVLIAKYGPSKRFDFLRNGSIWNEPKDWMMGLKKKERSLSSFWPPESEELIDNVSNIHMEAVALGTEKAFISLTYEFKNSRECIDLIKKSNNSAL